MTVTGTGQLPYYRAVPAKPSTYRRVGRRSVRMRSRLEVAAAKILDRYRIAWRYEPAVFSDHFRKGTGYRPDFVLWEGRAWPWYLEVKPAAIHERQPVAALHTALDRMGVIRLTEPTAVFALWIVDSALGRDGALLVNLPDEARWTAHEGTLLRGVARTHRHGR